MCESNNSAGCENCPLVSVLICTYNCESYIKNTLDSVINQSYDNIEILIRDNNSIDNTPQILEEYSNNHKNIAIFIENTNIGPYNGLNSLIGVADGKYIAIQDHDDIWHPKKLEFQIKKLENTEYKACGSLGIKLFEGTDRVAYVSWPEVDYYAPHPSLVFTNGDYRYDSDLTYKGDMYFMKYILSDGEKGVYNIQKPLYMSLVRGDGKNLSDQWTSPPKILKYYQYTHEIKYLLYYTLAKVSSRYITELIREKIGRDWEYDNLESVMNDEFEREYGNYIQKYIS